MRRDRRILAGLVGLAACATGPDGTDPARLRTEGEALVTALGAEVFTSLHPFGFALVTVFAEIDPAGDDLTIPAALTGTTLTYDPGAGGYDAAVGGGAPPDGVRARLYRVLPSYLPVLPLQDIGRIDLRPGAVAGTMAVAVEEAGGASVAWLASRVGDANRGTGTVSVGGVDYQLEFILPALPSATHSAELVGGGRRLSVQWDFPGPSEVVNVGWSYAGRAGDIGAEGEYTVRGPDLVFTVDGVPTARYTFESSHRPAVESLLDRPLTPEEEALVSGFEPIHTAMTSMVYGLAAALRW